MRRALAGLLVGIVGAVGLNAVPGVASAASDDPHIAGPLTIQSVPNGRMVDVDGGEMRDGRKIQEWTYNGSGAQQWRLRRAGSHHQIEAVTDPAFCLGREHDGDLARVVLRRCADGLTDWAFQALGGERYRITNPAGGLHLHVWNEVPTNGRELVVSANGETGAQWYLTDLAAPRRAMPADPRLDQLSFLVAHNAMANSDEGFWGRFPNQSYRLRDQLYHGIRGLQLDVHAYRGDVRMCHGTCWGNERTLSDGLRDVVGFLGGNRDAVVTVFLEDYTSVDELRSAVERVPGLPGLLFHPDRSGVRDHGWPRLSDLVSSNRRLLIFSQRPGREGFGVMYDRDWTAENYWSLEGGGALDCYSRWGEVPLPKEEPGFRRLHVMNHYRNIPTEWAATADNGAKLSDRVRRICGPSARRKPNYVAVDFYQKPEGGATWDLIRELNTYW
ncbi:RICIN domain-containing protein [Micromonospora purpureochromogenes]|uniref:RICIN domain-containing protein n=1 Tax=Micromonospora purpureochromogenes TaxID=47872 RepID=UPI0033CA273D